MQSQIYDQKGSFQKELEQQDAYHSLIFDATNPSSMNDWPTKQNPYGAFEYTSIILSSSHDLGRVEFYKPDLLELLGICGGLLFVLKAILSKMIGSVSSFSQQSALLSSTTKYVASQTKTSSKASKKTTGSEPKENDMQTELIDEITKDLAKPTLL